MKTTDSDTQQVVDYCTEQAQQLLNNHQELRPFGAVVTMSGEFHPVEHFEDVDVALAEEFEEDAIRCYALATGQRIEVGDNAEMSDAIVIKLFHKENSDLPTLTIPYLANASGVVKLGKMFGTHNKAQ